MNHECIYGDPHNDNFDPFFKSLMGTLDKKVDEQSGAVYSCIMMFRRVLKIATIKIHTCANLHIGWSLFYFQKQIFFFEGIPELQADAE